MSLQFTCPNCGTHRLEEIMSDVSVASEIASINEEGDHDYGEQTNEDGYIAKYQCIHCGHILMNNGSVITDCIEMAEWVKNNCPQEK